MSSISFHKIYNGTIVYFLVLVQPRSLSYVMQKTHMNQTAWIMINRMKTCINSIGVEFNYLLKHISWITDLCSDALFYWLYLISQVICYNQYIWLKYCQSLVKYHTCFWFLCSKYYLKLDYIGLGQCQKLIKILLNSHNTLNWPIDQHRHFLGVIQTIS